MHILLEGAVRPGGPARYCGRLYQLGSFPGAVMSCDPADVVHGGHEPSFGRARLHEIIDAYLKKRDR